MAHPAAALTTLVASGIVHGDGVDTTGATSSPSPKPTTGWPFRVIILDLEPIFEPSCFEAYQSSHVRLLRPAR